MKPTPSDYRVGDRVRHRLLRESGNVIRASPLEVHVRYDHGPHGIHAPERRWTGIYNAVWFDQNGHLLQHVLNESPNGLTVGARVRHLYEEGTIVHADADEVLVHFERGPGGKFFGPDNVVVAQYTAAWFRDNPHKLWPVPAPDSGQVALDAVRHSGNRLVPIIHQMNRVFNGKAHAESPRNGCLAIVWARDGGEDYTVLANGIATPELRAAVVDLLTKLDGDLRDD